MTSLSDSSSSSEYHYFSVASPRSSSKRNNTHAASAGDERKNNGPDSHLDTSATRSTNDRSALLKDNICRPVVAGFTSAPPLSTAEPLSPHHSTSIDLVSSLPFPETYEDLVSSLRCAMEDYPLSKEAKQEDWLPVAKLKDRNWECKLSQESIRGLNHWVVDEDIVYIWGVSDEHQGESEILQALTYQVHGLTGVYEMEHDGTKLPKLFHSKEYGVGYGETTRRMYDAAVYINPRKLQPNTVLMLYQLAWEHEKTWKHMDVYQCELLSYFSNVPNQRGTYFLCEKVFHEVGDEPTAMSFLLVLYDLTQPFQLPLDQHPFSTEHKLLHDSREHVHIKTSTGKDLGHLAKYRKDHWNENFLRAPIIQVNYFKTSTAPASDSKAAKSAQEIVQFTTTHQKNFPSPAVIDLGTVDVNGDPNLIAEAGNDFTIPADPFLNVALVQYVTNMPNDKLSKLENLQKRNDDLVFTIKTGEFVEKAMKRRYLVQSGNTTIAATTTSRKRKSESPVTTRKSKKMRREVNKGEE